MRYLAGVELPIEFILKNGVPTGAEIAYAYRRGWLNEGEVVTLAVEKMKRGFRLSAKEEELTLLLGEDLDRAPNLIESLEISDETQEERQRIWAFLILM
jgi:hypothetical protein